MPLLVLAFSNGPSFFVQYFNPFEQPHRDYFPHKFSRSISFEWLSDRSLSCHRILTDNLFDESTSPNSRSDVHHYVQVTHQSRLLFPQNRMPAVLDLNRSSFGDESIDKFPFKAELVHPSPRQ
jgi:hypothetical protein